MKKNNPKSATKKVDYKSTAADNLAGWQRERADFENFRKEVSRRELEFGRLAIKGFMKGLVPYLRNLERAFANIPQDMSPSVKAWFEGVAATRSELSKILQNFGMEEVAPTVGSEFDPQEHEAILVIKTDKVPVGKVAQLMAKGYRLNDTIVEPAQVGVADKNKNN